ncbi:MAG TPA: response regulator [Terracidiphilus sp.]|jgi:DNA-binding response OmpR family regulator|nr:response regulator [Terracidiphilus sp.]
MPALESKSRILIVDDDISVAESLGLIFESRGYEVREAFSGEHAIELVVDWHPDVAILDVILPHMNGIELARGFAEILPRCGIVLVSGHPAAQEILTRSEILGHSYDILAKPLHPALLLDRVAEMLHGEPVRLSA